jgi:hypothetical protein
MKTSRKVEKNICKNKPFWRRLEYTQTGAAKSRYFSGVPPSGRKRIPPEIAVNMAEFSQSEDDSR